MTDIHANRDKSEIARLTSLRHASERLLASLQSDLATGVEARRTLMLLLTGVAIGLATVVIVSFIA